MKKRWYSTTLWALVATLGILIFHYLGWTQTLESIVVRTTGAVTGNIYTKGMDLQGQFSIKKRSELISENEQLQQQVNQQKIETTRIQFLQEENRSLRSLLALSEEYQKHTLGAEVIGRSIDVTSNTIIIDVGEKEGMEVDRVVLSPEGALVGKIAKVLKDTSIVRLLDDSQSKIAAAIQNTEGSIGVLEGGFGIVTRLNLIPQNETVTVGDTVVTSGIEMGIARGIPIGTIEEVQSKNFEPFQNARVRTFAALHKLHLVLILLPQ